MAARMIVDRRDDLEAMPLVERWCLERERHQHDLRAAAPLRLSFRGQEQLRAESVAALRLVDPKLSQLTGTAPCVAADPRQDALAIAHEEREQLAVGDVRRARVELVDPIFQVL